MYPFCHSDCIVKEMRRVKVNTLLKWMLLVGRERVYAVEGKDVYLRNSVGGFLADKKPSFS